MDQAAPTHQSVIQHVRECSKIGDLDCHRELRIGRNSKETMNMDVSLYTLLQVLSLTLFDRTPINQLVSESDYDSQDPLLGNLLTFFD